MQEARTRNTEGREGKGAAPLDCLGWLDGWWPCGRRLSQNIKEKKTDAVPRGSFEAVIILCMATLSLTRPRVTHLTYEMRQGQVVRPERTAVFQGQARRQRWRLPCITSACSFDLGACPKKFPGVQLYTC
jgi:hypothetical protein